MPLELYKEHLLTSFLKFQGNGTNQVFIEGLIENKVMAYLHKRGILWWLEE